MKKLLAGALALLALTACNKDSKGECLQQEAMQFGSNVPALNFRMAGSAFEANDAIGISMTGDTTTTNVKYKTTAGGATATFASTATGLTFAEGQTINFVSYYPYSASATTNLAINLTNDQTDVLHSNNLTGTKAAKVANGTNHVLQLTHKLALMSSTVTGLSASTTITLAQLEGIVTTSSMKIADGILTNGTAKAAQKLQLAADAFAPAIVTPATNANAKLVVKLSNGKSYSYTFASLVLQSDKNHKFNVTLASGAITVDQVNGQITDWDVVDGGNIAVVPDSTSDAAPPPTPQPQPGDAELFFPGADFEDFAVFKDTLNRFGLRNYATEVAGAGRNGGKALHIKGTPKDNSYVSTAANKEGKDFNGETKAIFYIKGTATSKSLSFNLYPEDKTAPDLFVTKKGEKYYTYNLGVIDDAEANLSVAKDNQYNDNITATGWVKVTLDIIGRSIARGGNLIAFRVGKGVVWDLYIDDITIE